MAIITDTVTLGDIRVSSENGYLETFAYTARAGVQQYRGAEVGRDDLNIVNVYRDEAEVFAKRSLDTFAKIPVTVDHPPEAVSAENWKKYAVGTSGEEVLRDGERLKIGLKITDKAAVEVVQDGKRELSVGYTANLVWDEGVAPDGTPYQARQTSIAANHIAIVARGRAGPQCCISDSWAALSTVTDERTVTMPNRTVMVDGLSVETTDQGAQAIEKLIKDRDEARAALSDAQKGHNEALAAKDADLAKKDHEIDDLKSKALDDAAIDKLVADRADLVAKAKAIVADVKTDGKTAAEIRKAVVTSKLGEDVVRDKADAYIDARFDILVEDVQGTDAVRDAIRSGTIPTNDYWSDAIFESAGVKIKKAS